MMGLEISLDLFPLTAAVLAAVVCGLLGNFLVLRRLSLMGDAISHSVLPGLVIAFLVSSSRAPLAMFIGAAVAGLATVVLVELVKRVGRVEPGAAMGVVFSVLFALGVLLIERAAVRHVDLDADCVLYGQLETLVWFGGPEGFGELFRLETLSAVPRQVWTLLGMTAAAFVFVGVFFKELRIAAFDPALATAQGFSSGAMHYVLMVFVAAATVASFEAVGSILVIAMLICPAATARLLTDRLVSQVWCSVVVAVVCAVGGYWLAIALPGLWGKDAVNAAGMMTVVAGGGVAGAVVLSPRQGLVVGWIRRSRLARQVAIDDLLAALYRAAEAGEGGVARGALLERFRRRPMVGKAIGIACRRGLVVERAGVLELTDRGEAMAVGVVRRHRLWEHYLVERAGVAPDHVHGTAARLEHLDTAVPGGVEVDPHGRRIP